MSAPITPCAREGDVLDLIAIGQWPSRANRDLVDHVATCERCTDLAVVAAAILDLRGADEAAGRVPDGGLVWYRAQLRAREAAVVRAARPLLVAQIAALVLVVGALAVWASGQADSLVAAGTATWTTAANLLDNRPDWPAFSGIGGALAVLSPGLLASLAGGLLALIGLAFGVSRLADGGR